MKIITQIGLAAGLLLLLSLLVWQGVLDVIDLLITCGWGLLWLPVVWLPNFLPATQGWRVLFAKQYRPSFKFALLAMWMGRAVNNLLPVATIGGEIVKARLISLWGGNGINAAASVMVDKVVQALSVAIWGFTGIGALLYLTANNELALYAFTGFIALVTGAVGFLYVQKAGLLGILATLGGKLIKSEAWEDIADNAKEIDAVISGIYSQKYRITQAVFLRTLGLMLQTIEVWLACYLLGYPVTIVEAIMLKSLTATLSDVAFVIPNAYGIQEGAYIMVGAMIGLTPDVALAVSLALRIRDLAFDPPGLYTLHHIETKHYLRRKTSSPLTSTQVETLTD